MIIIFMYVYFQYLQLLKIFGLGIYLKSVILI